MLVIPTYALSRDLFPQVEFSETTKALAYVVGVPTFVGMLIGGFFGAGGIGAGIGFGLSVGAIIYCAKKIS